MKKWLLFTLIALALLAADQISKTHVMATMEPGPTISVIGDTFSWHLTFNKGALFGLQPADLIPGLSPNTFFYIFTAIALFFLINYVRKMELIIDPVVTLIGLATVTGGAIGNLLDRVIATRPGVVDFFMVNLGFSLGPIPFDPWPIFNVADIGITVGVALIIVGSFIEAQSEKNPMHD